MIRWWCCIHIKPWWYERLPAAITTYDVTITKHDRKSVKYCCWGDKTFPNRLDRGILCVTFVWNVSCLRADAGRNAFLMIEKFVTFRDTTRRTFLLCYRAQREYYDEIVLFEM